jgi:hypothetical protein
MRWKLALLVLLSGCAPPKRATMEQLFARSSFELGCSPGEMQFYDFGQRVKGVAGCGRRLTYVERCEANICAWVLDAPGRDQLAWPSSAPPPPPQWAAPAPQPTAAPPAPPRAAAPPPAPPPPVATTQPATADWGF